MKKNLGILSLALVAGLSLVGCNKADNNKAMGSVIKTKQDVYAYSMFSSSTLLDNLSAPAVASLAAETDAQKKEEINKIDEYVKMFDGLLAKKGIDQKTEKNSDTEFKDYETKMTVVQSGKTYVSYLNETAKNEADKGKEDSEEEEVETLLSGLMFEMDADNKPVASYLIEGSKEIEKETEEGETEEELSIEMTSFLAVKNAETGVYEKVADAKTVTVKQEFETETKEDGTVEKEQAFKYTVKDKDGNVINDECSKVEIEEENGETEISLMVGNDEENAKIYEFSKQGNELEIEVYEGEDNKVETINVIMTTDEKTGVTTYEYTFSDGNKVTEKDDD